MNSDNLYVQTAQQATTFWSSFAKVYSKLDSTPQTFYYTLINMLDLHNAKHILEVGCGTAKLLPLAVNLKPKQATYLTTDLTPCMVEMAEKGLEEFIKKAGVTVSYHEWIKRKNISFKAINGELPIESPYKYDRIIANLVLMLTQDPIKMMKNFYNMAEQDCLLGVTVWGNQADNNFFTVIPQAMKANGIKLPNVRNAFHLYNKLQELGEQTGWEVIIDWQQNVPFSHIELDDDLKEHIAFSAGGDLKVMEYITERVKAIFADKKALNFPCQLAILRKKKSQ